jgi:hypothetical protein
MRRVHAELRSIGNRTDPLDIVAQAFRARDASSAWMSSSSRTSPTP